MRSRGEMDKIDSRVISALTRSSKISNGLASVLSTSEQKVEALVRVRNPIQLGLLERQFDVIACYPFIRSVGIRCGIGDALTLERMSEVEYVSAQGKAFTLEKEFAASNAFNYPIPQLSKGLDGNGVTLCVMDTGVSPHLDLSVPKERIIGAVDMINGEIEPYDDNGHGTFVAGVACGNGICSKRQIVGVAPKANVLSVKVIEDKGESGTFKILDGMQWLFDNFRRYGVRVVCMSFGAEPLEYADPLKMGAEMLSRSGLIVVVASGNSGDNTLKSPAISQEVISVGAVDCQNVVAPFTSRGTYMGAKRPDLYAQGVSVQGLKRGGVYTMMSGTSVSAPYVAGACCLLCQKYRGLTPYQAKLALINECIDVDGNMILRL